MKNRIILLLITSFLLKVGNSALAQLSPIDTSQYQILRVDPSSAKGIPVSKLFEKVDFVPLETTTESTFGTVSQLDILGNRYVIFDVDTKAVLIFSLEGKFVNKINASKIPKSEIAEGEVRGFELKKIDNNTVIAILAGNKRFFYDKDGAYLSQVTVSLSDYQKYFMNNSQDSVAYELALVSEDGILKSYFPFDKKRFIKDQFIGGGNTFSYDEAARQLFYTTYYNYSIFQGTTSGLIEKYRLMFPFENSLPSDFLTNASFIKKRLLFFKSNPKMIFGVSNIIHSGNYLMFKLSNFGGGLKNMLCLNLRTHELISLNDIERDEASEFLPVTDNGVGYDFSNKGFLLNKQGFLYTSYSSLAMFKFYEMVGGGKIGYSPNLLNYFKNENSRSNPLIIRLKVKN
jgi:hypothetical protein